LNLHDLLELRSGVGNRLLRLAVLHHQRLAGEFAEVHEDVGSLGRRQHHLLDRHRHVEQAAFGADLPQRRAADVKAQDPRIAAIENAEAIHARLDV
jgi:hypothetical protein